MDRVELARILLGQGMLGHAADVMKLRPIYDEEFINASTEGKDYPSFEDWFKEMKDHAQKWRTGVYQANPSTPLGVRN